MEQQQQQQQQPELELVTTPMAPQVGTAPRRLGAPCASALPNDIEPPSQDGAEHGGREAPPAPARGERTHRRGREPALRRRGAEVAGRLDALGMHMLFFPTL